jgi:hypothetical protein
MKTKSKGIGDSPKGYENPAPYLKDGTKRQPAPKVVVNTFGGNEKKVEGKKASPRLDKHARGGKVKNRPDVSVNVVTARPPLRRRRLVGTPQANARALAALAARRGGI